MIYVGWSWRKRFPDWTTDHQGPSLTGKQMVESSRLRKAGVGGRGRKGGGGGTRADKPQFQFINRVATAFDTESAAAMLKFVARKTPSRDPQLIDVVRHLIDPPPTEGPRLLSRAAMKEKPQSTEVDVLLNKTVAYILSVSLTLCFYMYLSFFLYIQLYMYLDYMTCMLYYQWRS